MTYNEKKSLYESIMKEMSKTIKQMINEAGVDSLDSIDNNGKTSKVTLSKTEKLALISKSIAEIFADVIDGTKDRKNLNIPVLISRIQRGLEMIEEEEMIKQFFLDLKKAFNKK